MVPLEGLLVGESLGMAVNTEKYIRLDLEAAEAALFAAPGAVHRSNFTKSEGHE